MIEGNTLADNNWPYSFRQYWRNIDDNPSCTIGWVPGLRPIGVRASKNASMVAVLKLLTLLQLSDCNDVLIVHTIKYIEFRGKGQPP